MKQSNEYELVMIFKNAEQSGVESTEEMEVYGRG